MRALLATALATLVAGVAASPALAAPTIVTFGFDDGTADHYDIQDLLAERGVKATFFVNSGKIGDPGHLTYDQLRAMQAAGHEIGGHTINHTNLVAADPATRVTEVCDDRTALTDEGLNVTSFSYPHGQWILPGATLPFDASETVESVVRDCGYRSARTTEGITADCDLCAAPWPWEPELDYRAYSTRAWQYIETSLDPRPAAERIKGAIRAAHENGVGWDEAEEAGQYPWLQIVLHDVCDGDCAGADDYTISRTELADVLDWLVEHRSDGDGYVVATTAQAVSGVLPSWNPPDPGGDPGPGEGPGNPGDQEPPPPVVGGGGGGGSAGGGPGPTVPTPAPPPGPPVEPPAPPAPTATVTQDAASTSAPALRVRMLKPKGAKNRRKGRLLLRVRVSDPASVERVEFLVNGRVVRVDRRAPFRKRIAYRAKQRKKLALSVRVVQTSGEVTTETLRRLTVGRRR